MDGFRIRRGGEEVAVPDVAGLVELARTGRLGRADEVRTGRGWVRAESLPELVPYFTRDPWAAWSDVDEVDAASLYRRMVDGEPEEISPDALVPVPEKRVIITKRPSSSDELPSLDPDAIEPMDVEPVSEEPRRPPALAAVPGARDPAKRPSPPRPLPPLARETAENGTEIIDFPRPPPMPMFPERPRRPAGPPPLVRASRVVTMVMVGGFILMTVWFWVRMNARSDAGFSSPPPTQARAASAPAAAPSPPSTAMLALEAELRAQLSPTPKVIKKPGDLADTLLVELVQMRVDVDGVNAEVIKWVGRKKDEPKTAEVRVVFNKSDDIGRDIGAIALVVGRYKRLYHLELPVFEVTEKTSGGRTLIDPTKAELFYQGRLPLGRFLADLPKG